MHEFALAEAVVTATLRAAEKEGFARILAVAVEVGELQHIERELFELALREVLPAGEPRLERAEFRVSIAAARFACVKCGRIFTLEESGGPANDEEREAIHFVPELAHAFLKCPDCASPDFEIRRGRGVRIASIEGEQV